MVQPTAATSRNHCDLRALQEVFIRKCFNPLLIGRSDRSAQAGALSNGKCTWTFSQRGLVFWCLRVCFYKESSLSFGGRDSII